MVGCALEDSLPLAVTEFVAEGYRSLRALRMPVEPLTVFVGANGAGKTNLYRGLQLVQSAASGSLARDLAEEGGMDSAFWAGIRKPNRPVRIRLGVTLQGRGRGGVGLGSFGYEVELGLRPPAAAGFPLEPQIKEEIATFQTGARRQVLMQRRGPSLSAMDEDGRRGEVDAELLPSETALSRLEDPSRYPDLHLIRQTLLDWRFHHDFRTDKDSRLREPALAVTSTTLNSDGSNLAAVFATLAHIREDTADLAQAVRDAFPGARLHIPSPERTASFGLIFPDYPKRVFEAAELSDGTLRFLALAGALLAYRAPAFVALNEPEVSLHPDLLEPLARLIVSASERSQIWLVTHSERLAAAIQAEGGPAPRTVIKKDGATWIEGLKLFGRFDDDDED
jgi:predicted ATPase